MFLVKTSAAIWLVCERKELSLSAAGDETIVFRRALWRISTPFVSDIVLGRSLIIHLLNSAETDQWFKVVRKEVENENYRNRLHDHTTCFHRNPAKN